MLTGKEDDAPGPIDMPRGNAREVLAVFLRLGLTSFGGPIAHLGYFHDEFVVRRRWLDEKTYADLVALCQFLPGPASSQVGIAIGLSRAGYLGSLAAWLGFTLPSAVALVLFAYGVEAFGGALGGGWLHGLKVVAVAVVAQAVLSMMRALAPDRERATLAVVAAALVLTIPSAWGQIGAIVLGAAVGLVVLRGAPPVEHGTLPHPVSRNAGLVALVLFFALLLGLPLLAAAVPSQGLTVFEAFYRAGSLVFGGGHVVLPLLQAAVVPPGWVTNDAFLAGYGAAQAVPGPLFTFAAYLGAVMSTQPNGWPAPCSASSRSSCRRSCSSSARFHSGMRCASAGGRNRPCAASTLPSWVCCWPRSTSRYGPWASPVPKILRWRSRHFCCCSCGRRRLGSWSSSARRLER